MKKLPKELQTHCHLSMTILTPTGERRQLTDAEVAERMQKILDIPPAERIRMYFPHTPEQKEEQ